MYGPTQDDIVRAVFLVLNTRLLKRPLRKPDWTPNVDELAGVTFGYPGEHVNAKTLENEAALHFVEKPARGSRVSLTRALEEAERIAEGKKPKGRAAKKAAADDKSDLTETASDDAVVYEDALADEDDDNDDDDAQSVEGLEIKSQGAYLRQLTKEADRKDKAGEKGGAGGDAQKEKTTQELGGGRGDAVGGRFVICNIDAVKITDLECEFDRVIFCDDGKSG